MTTAITRIHAREILDSRGNPTLEAEVTLASGHIKLAIGLDYLDACPVRGVRLGGGDEDLSTAAEVSSQG